MSAVELALFISHTMATLLDIKATATVGMKENFQEQLSIRFSFFSVQR